MEHYIFIIRTRNIQNRKFTTSGYNQQLNEQLISKIIIYILLYTELGKFTIR